MMPAGVIAALTADIGMRMGWPAGGASGMREWLGLPDPEVPPAPYDLASAAADLPPREPTRSLVIATDYRTGSTLLAEALAGAGGYGIPLEYLQRGAMARRYARFAEPSPADFLTRVMHARTSASGVFGIKLFWPESPSLHHLPDPLVIHLRRADVVAQAVSTWTALITHQWRAIAAHAHEVPYDGERLMALTAMHAHHDACWSSRLAELPASRVITTTYESLAADPVTEAANLVHELAARGMPPSRSIPPPRLTRQSGRSSAHLASRLADALVAAYGEA